LLIFCFIRGGPKIFFYVFKCFFAPPIYKKGGGPPPNFKKLFFAKVFAPLGLKILKIGREKKSKGGPLLIQAFRKKKGFKPFFAFLFSKFYNKKKQGGNSKENIKTPF
jgi:hypothetical protein